MVLRRVGLCGFQQWRTFLSVLSGERMGRVLWRKGSIITRLWWCPDHWRMSVVFISIS